MGVLYVPLISCKIFINDTKISGGIMKPFIKIRKVIDYNKYCLIKFKDYYFHTFNKKYGYVLYGYNSLNTKNDFAFWFKTKKEAINKLKEGE